MNFYQIELDYGDGFSMPLNVSDQTIKIGVVGYGTVGEELCRLVGVRAKEVLKNRGGVEFEVVKVAMRDVSKVRGYELPPELRTTEWQEVVEHPEVQIVVELIGGTGTAFEVVQRALELGRPVVTGNKALLAERGREIFSLSEQYKTPVLFEAAVAGGIPIIKSLREAFVCNETVRLVGIINGTCNYILERMTEVGLSYEQALQEAIELGYAEADPTLDINGWDAGHKAILLGAVSYGFLPDYKDVYVKGVEEVTLEDITLAKRLGYVVKLVSVVKSSGTGQVEIRTQPSLIPQSHLLAKVDGVFNAVSYHGDIVGDAFFYGRGAGGGPTSTAVIADLLDAVSALSGGYRGYLPDDTANIKLALIQDTESAYFVRLRVQDQPGVMAKITALFSERGISFSGTHSEVNPQEPDAEMNQVVFITHNATFGMLKEALRQLESLDCVTDEPKVYRIESL